MKNQLNRLKLRYSWRIFLLHLPKRGDGYLVKIGVPALAISGLGCVLFLMFAMPRAK